MHWCAGSPALSTWCRAIDAGYFKSWPGLTAAAVRKHLPQSIPMHKGHLDQQRKNVRSTKQRDSKAKPKIYPGTDEPSDAIHPKLPEHRTDYVFASCEPITGQIYSDQPENSWLTRAGNGADRWQIAAAVRQSRLPNSTSGSSRSFLTMVCRLVRPGRSGIAERIIL